jgi:hypothetical protein
MPAVSPAAKGFLYNTGHFFRDMAAARRITGPVPIAEPQPREHL